MNRISRVIWRASLALMLCGAGSLPAEAQTWSGGGALVTFLNGKDRKSTRLNSSHG